MTKPTRTVELQTAYHWWCEDCGGSNFAAPMKAEFGPGEREEAYRRFHEMDGHEVLPDGWEQFEMVTIPHEVACKFCGAKFAAIDDFRTHAVGRRSPAE